MAAAMLLDRSILGLESVRSFAGLYHRGKPHTRVQDPAACCLKPSRISDDMHGFLRRACVRVACLPAFRRGGRRRSSCHCTPRSLAMPLCASCCAHTSSNCSLLRPGLGHGQDPPAVWLLLPQNPSTRGRLAFQMLGGRGCVCWHVYMWRSLGCNESA